MQLLSHTSHVTSVNCPEGQYNTKPTKREMKQKLESWATFHRHTLVSILAAKKAVSQRLH